MVDATSTSTSTSTDGHFSGIEDTIRSLANSVGSFSMDPSALADVIAIEAFLAFAAVSNARIESLSHRLLVEADKNKEIADTQAALSTATSTDGSADVSVGTLAKINSHYKSEDQLKPEAETKDNKTTYHLTSDQVTAAQHRMDQLATGLSQISQELQVQLQYALASQQTAYESASKIINDIKSQGKSIDSNF